MEQPSCVFVVEYETLTTNWIKVGYLLASSKRSRDVFDNIPFQGALAQIVIRYFQHTSTATTVEYFVAAV